jgi:hypothetical protein
MIGSEGNVRCAGPNRYLRWETEPWDLTRADGAIRSCARVSARKAEREPAVGRSERQCELLAAPHDSKTIPRCANTDDRGRFDSSALSCTRSQAVRLPTADSGDKAPVLDIDRAETFSLLLIAHCGGSVPDTRGSARVSGGEDSYGRDGSASKDSLISLP